MLLHSRSMKFAIVTAGLGILLFGSAALFAIRLPNKDERLGNLANLATAVGTFVTAVALLVTMIGVLIAAWQLSITRRIALGEFLLHVDELLLGVHKDVYYKLREGGDWQDKMLSPKDLDSVVPYAGLFERIKGN